MPEPNDAAFCAAIICPRCYDVNHLGYTATHPATDGSWRCDRCAHAYPNSDALKAAADRVRCIVFTCKAQQVLEGEDADNQA